MTEEININEISFNPDMSRRQFAANFTKLLAISSFMRPGSAYGGIPAGYNPLYRNSTGTLLDSSKTALREEDYLKNVLIKVVNGFVPPTLDVRKKMAADGYDIVKNFSDYLVPQGPTMRSQMVLLLNALDEMPKVFGIFDKNLRQIEDDRKITEIFLKCRDADSSLFEGIGASVFRGAKILALQAVYLNEKRMWKEMRYSGPWLKDPNRVEEDVTSATSFELAPQMEKNIRDLKKNTYAKPQEIKTKFDKMNFDVIVIGSGAGGSVTAMNLSKKGKKVLVIEKGDFVEPKYFVQREKYMIPKLYDFEISSRTIGKFPGAQGLELPDMKASVVRGRLVGGSATINHALAFRTPDPVLREWKDNHGFKHDLDDSFDEIANLLHIAKVPEQQVCGNNRLLKEAHETLAPKEEGKRNKYSHHDISPRNVKDCRGCGFCDMGCRYNRKQTPLNVILPEAARNDAKIIANSEVEKVLFESDKKTVRGVKVTLLDELRNPAFSDDSSIEIYAPKVIVATGAMDAPRVLMRSGIKNKNIGERFICHAPLTMYGEFAEPFYPTAGGPPMSYYGKFFENDREGKKSPKSDHITFALEGIFNHPVTHSQLMPFDSPEGHLDYMKKYNNIMSLVLLFKDKPTNPSRAINEANPRKRIKEVGFEYELSQSEKSRMTEALRESARLMFAAGAKKVFFNTTKPVIIEKSDNQEAAIKAKLPNGITGDPTKFMITSGHPQGGNTMGISAETSVVNAKDASVWGTKGLYVFDGSILPTSVGVNPSYTIYTLSNFYSKQLASKS